MTHTLVVARLRAFLAQSLFLALSAASLGAPIERATAQAAGGVRVSQVRTRFHLVASTAGNLIVYVDDSLSLVAGYQAPELVRAARNLLRTLEAPPLRYVVSLNGDSAVDFGDGGWGNLGVWTVVHEDMRYRMQQHVDSGRKWGATPLMGKLPNIAFAEALQLHLPNEEAHVVRRTPGLSRSDVVMHFEDGNVMMLGNLVVADEYPDIPPRGASIPTYLQSIDFFLQNFRPAQIEPIVPIRGRTLTMAELRAYRAMLGTVVERVNQLRAAGRTEDEVVAAKPTAEFDAQWGRGRVTPERFVRSLFRAPPPPPPKP
jgi:cyclase